MKARRPDLPGDPMPPWGGIITPAIVVAAVLWLLASIVPQLLTLGQP